MIDSQVIFEKVLSIRMVFWELSGRALLAAVGTKIIIRDLIGEDVARLAVQVPADRGEGGETHALDLSRLEQR